MKIKLLALSLAALFLASCGSYHKSLYMQNDSDINHITTGQLYDFRIMPKDELTIVISTTDPEASAPFYRKIGQSKENISSNMQNLGMNDAKLLTYLVDNSGCIDLPVLGLIKVNGLTVRECENLIREKLAPYLKESPNVTVRNANYKYSVLGEVAKPGTYSVSSEKVTLFEALAQAGDMTLNSVREDVQLLRENENGVRRIVHLNLLDASITQSPYFYLQQNDVIYVKPKKAKVNTNTFNTNTSMWITMISVLTSVSTLIIALTK